MYTSMQDYLKNQLGAIRSGGLYKNERLIAGPQAARILVKGGKEVLNMCANNYLGLADHPEVKKAAEESYKKWGYGLSSVRFICGTQVQHTDLEAKLAEFLGTDDTILYSSCFDANTGLFETLLGPKDAIISDQLNHASIIDGVRLCKAQRFRYHTCDMEDLEAKLKEARDARFKMIATDGVFSMDGTIAKLDGICDLAEKYDALVMIDDSHAVGFMGARGKGTHEYRNVMGRVDIITGTLGKALGGAAGGFVASSAQVIDMLTQSSRPQIFSNALPATIAASASKAVEVLEANPSLVKRLHENAAYLRNGLRERGFQPLEAPSAIIPILVGETSFAIRMSEKLLDEGIFVTGFGYPVVPEGAARLRVQASAALEQEDMDRALETFSKVGTEVGLL